MPTRDELLDYIDTWYGHAYTYFALAKDDIWEAKQQFGVWTDKKVLETLINGCWRLYTSVGALIGYAEPTTIDYQIPYFLREFTIAEAPDAGITMRMILDEMFTADNEELKQFIALVDAYRQSLWNKPFDVNYWAAVARGFEVWEF